MTDFPALGEITKRQRQAIDLREQKKTFREIGEALGISTSAANYLYRRGRRAQGKPIKDWSRKIAREALMETFKAAFTKDEFIG
jgi:DNA-directed RNA polymerase specialized sigma24 family protein